MVVIYIFHITNEMLVYTYTLWYSNFVNFYSNIKNKSFPYLNLFLKIIYQNLMNAWTFSSIVQFISFWSIWFVLLILLLFCFSVHMPIQSLLLPSYRLSLAYRMRVLFSSIIVLWSLRKRKYFCSYWNIFEFLNLLLSYFLSMVSMSGDNWRYYNQFVQLLAVLISIV